MSDLQSKVQDLLKERFQVIQRVQPGFSIRAFARELGLGVGTVSDVLNGKRKVSKKLAIQVSEKLKLEPREQAELLALCDSENPSYHVGRMEEEVLSGQDLLFLTQWHTVAIWNLMRLPSFQSDHEWIAARLGLPVSLIDESMRQFCERGFVRREFDGVYVRLRERLFSSDEVPSDSIRAAHLENLKLARDALGTLGVEERDFTLLTLPMHPGQLSLVKVMIRKFIEELHLRLKATELPPTDVYRVSLQVFPLTEPEHPGKEKGRMNQ